MQYKYLGSCRNASVLPAERSQAGVSAEAAYHRDKRPKSQGNWTEYPETRYRTLPELLSTTFGFCFTALLFPELLHVRPGPNGEPLKISVQTDPMHSFRPTSGIEARNKFKHDKWKQEQQRLAVGPGNAHLISIRQLSSDAATLRPLLLALLCIGNLMIEN